MIVIELNNVAFGTAPQPPGPPPENGDADDARPGKMLIFQDQTSGIMVRVPLNYKAVKTMRKQLAEDIEIASVLPPTMR